MANEDNEPSRIRFHYELDPAARLETAHGVWGGINPHGEIEISFYNESDSLPSSTEQVLEPDGTLGHEIVIGESDVRHITRHIHSRILLNYETARAVMEWLEDRLADLEQADAGVFGNSRGVQQ